MFSNGFSNFMAAGVSIEVRDLALLECHLECTMPHPNDVDAGSFVGVAVGWLSQKGNDRYEWARKFKVL